MPSPLDGVSFVVDQNLIRLGRALSALRPDLAVIGHSPVADLLPDGILDSEWIPIVGDRGWVMITNDGRLRTRPTEAELATRHRLKVVHLHGAVGTQAAWKQAVRLFSRWEAIERHVHSPSEGPWWLSVRADAVRAMRYEPGTVERL
jgi:hypothetical protein